MPKGQQAFTRRYNIFKNNFFAFIFSGTDCELRNCLVDLANRYPEAAWDAEPFDRRSGGDRRNVTTPGPL
jgi:hypothetical protein